MADVEAARLLLRMRGVTDRAAKARVATLAAVLRCCVPFHNDIAWNSAFIPGFRGVAIIS